MGLFSGIKKAFKKITRGIKKVVKGVVRGVKKVVKKIGSSKILKALAIAAAVVVTGGAAIGAFGGKLATTGFGKFMMGASQKLAGGSLFGTKATGFLGGLQKAGNIASKVAFKPFVSVGQAAGNITGAVTDFTGLTSKAGRMGYTQIQPLGAGAIEPSNVGEFVKDPLRTSMDGRTLANIKGSTDTIHGTGTLIDSSGNVVKQALLDPKTGEAVASASKWKDIATTAAITSGTQLVSGLAQAKLLEGDPRGTAMPLANETKEYQDALQVFASNQGISLKDIYSHLSFGTADPSYQVNSELFSQQAFQPV